MGRKAEPWFWKTRKTWMVTINGVRHNLGPEKKAAEKKFHLLMGADEERQTPSGAVAEVLDVFLGWTKENRGEETYNRYLIFLQSLAKCCGRVPVSEFNSKQVTEWLDKKAWNSTTKRNAIIAVQRAFNWAVKNRGLLRNPILGMEKPEAKKRTTVMPPQDFETMLAAVTDQPFKDLLIVAYDSGCRPQEIRRLEARHIDLVKQRAVIPSEEAKGNMPRAVYFASERSLDTIARLVREHPEGPLFLNLARNPWTRFAVKCRFDRLLVVIGQREMARLGIASAITDEAIKEMMEKLPKFRTNKTTGKKTEKKVWELRREAKLKLLAEEVKHYAKRCRQYDFRHSYITRKLLAGVDSHVVAALAGHRDTKMIDTVYSHVAQDHEFMLREASKDIKK